MKKVVILTNHDAYTYNFRKEIIKSLIDNGYKVYIVLPYGEKVELLKKMGCEFIDIPLDRRGTNPFTDFKLLFRYRKLLQELKPGTVLTYTIKPNLYGGIVCRLLKIPHIANITGLGSAIEKGRIIQKITLMLYRVAFGRINCVFLQNEENLQFFIDKRIAMGKHRLIPGSGVNLKHFQVLDYPSDEVIEFLFIGRVMKEKGIDLYIETAKTIKEKYPNTVFHILGFCEEAYDEYLKQLDKHGTIKFHGMQSDIRPFIEKSHCTIHPSYYPEGLSNVLIESAACGRPVIATNKSGCRETVDDGVTGFLVREKDSQDLIEKVEKFIQLDYENKKQMGLAGRAKIEKEFDRQIVVQAYMDEIEMITNV